MTSYDVYACGPRSGRLCRAYSFSAVDDVAAEAFVAERLTDRPVELWCRSRRVASFSGIKPTARVSKRLGPSSRLPRGA